MRLGRLDYIIRYRPKGDETKWNDIPPMKNPINIPLPKIGERYYKTEKQKEDKKKEWKKKKISIYKKEKKRKTNKQKTQRTQAHKTNITAARTLIRTTNKHNKKKTTNNRLTQAIGITAHSQLLTQKER